MMRGEAMANAVYMSLFAISIFNMLSLAVVVKRQKCFYYVLFFVLISISCFGYVTMANATNADVALLGNILTYFGACFLPYSFLLCMSELCQIPVKRWISMAMLVYNLIVFCLVWSTSMGCTLFYSGYELVYKGGIGVLVTTSGPCRILYEVSVVFFAAAVISLMYFAICRKKESFL